MGLNVLPDVVFAEKNAEDIEKNHATGECDRRLFHVSRSGPVSRKTGSEREPLPGLHEVRGCLPYGRHYVS